MSAERVVMAEVVRENDGATLVVNPGTDDEFELGLRLGESRVMGEEDQEAYPYEVIVSVVPRPIGGTWQGYPKSEWPGPTG